MLIKIKNISLNGDVDTGIETINFWDWVYYLEVNINRFKAKFGVNPQAVVVSEVMYTIIENHLHEWIRKDPYTAPRCISGKEGMYLGCARLYSSKAIQRSITIEIF